MGSPRFSRRSLLAGIGGLGVSRHLSAQTPEASPVPDIRIPRLRVGLGVVPNINAPVTARTLDEMWLSSLIYDSPLRWNAAGNVIGGLFRITPDTRSTKISIEPRMTSIFTDGTVVTSNHLVETLTALEGTAEAWRLQYVENYSVDDDGVLHIKLGKPDQSLIASLAHPRFGIESHGLGTGPFQPGINKSESIILRRNPMFWQIGRPHIDELEIKYIADDVQRTTAATTGEIDIMPNVPLLDVPVLQQEPALYLVGGSSNRLCHLQIQTSIPALSNARVRRVLSAAIDRAGLVTVATADQAEPTSHLFAPEYWTEDVPGAEHLPSGDVREQLTQLGIPPDWRLHLLTDNADATLANTAVILQEQLANCGISLSITLLEGDDLADAIRNGDYDLLVSYSEPWRDQHELVWPLLASNGPANWSGFNNVEVDTLLRAAIALPDLEFRSARYTRLENIIQREVPVIPLFRPYVWHAVNARYPGYSALPPATSRGMLTLLPTDGP